MWVRACAALAFVAGSATSLQAADFLCNNLVPAGSTMICPGFEPNWAVELVCSGAGMTANFVDAFSGDTITTTPGSVSFASDDPWSFNTNHGVAGTITYTPAACQDESDRTFDYTLSTTSVPGYNGQIASICCRIE